MTGIQIIGLIITAIASYFVGNINFAVIISKFAKSDIRKSGSGNPGTMNMLRTFGAKLGVLTLFLDAMKGFVPATIAKLVFANSFVASFCIGDLAMYIAGISVTLGHIFPVLMKFKGGKGVATTLGVFLASSPIPTLIIFLLGVLYIYFFEFGSMGSMLFLSGMAIYQGIIYNAKYVINGVLDEAIAPLYFALCVLILCTCLVTWLAHKDNIGRLIFGVEHKTELKKI
ncbi:MAG: glycerol-3-phosphate acyltransferase, partial [Clostridia bacterium]